MASVSFALYSKLHLLISVTNCTQRVCVSVIHLWYCHLRRLCWPCGCGPTGSESGHQKGWSGVLGSKLPVVLGISSLQTGNVLHLHHLLQYMCIGQTAGYWIWVFESCYLPTTLWGMKEGKHPPPPPPPQQIVSFVCLESGMQHHCCRNVLQHDIACIVMYCCYVLRPWPRWVSPCLCFHDSLWFCPCLKHLIMYMLRCQFSACYFTFDLIML